MEPGLPKPACLELALPPEEATRLWRAPALLSRRAGRARTTRAGTIWHDTANGALASTNMSLGQDRDVWRLERLRPAHVMDWLPAHRAPLLAQASAPQFLGWKLPDQLAPVAAFEGRLRTLALDAAGVEMVPSEEARQTCAMESGFAGEYHPAYVVRYTTDDLARLPTKLTARLANGREHRAAVGACVSNRQSAFSEYRIAVLLFP